jgi:EmrB/QacA subfamily drug resistance transporter
MVALLLAALDQTIVATALPHIVADIGGLKSYSWVITAYVLAMAVTVPLYGKLGDIYGRRRLYIVAITIFLAGSVLCGLAQSMGQLVAARAIQGMGGGGLFALAQATIGVIIPPRDRGRYQGLIGATFAAGSIIGPALGGLIVDNASWRWVFLVNLPVGIVALAVIAIAIPKRTQRREHSLDLLGATLLAIGTSAFLLDLVWGGEEHSWTSTYVLGAFAVALVSLTIFAFVERRAKEPILPFEFLRNSIVAAGVASVGLSAMAMVGTIAFVPLFVQGVIGSSASSSGVVLTPFMLGAVTASALSGQWISRSGHYRPNALVGPIVLGIGLFLLSTMGTSTTNAKAAAFMVVAGIGLGLMMQVFVVAVQNQVPMHAMGSVTALTQFSRSIGATIGVTAMGAIVNHGLPPGSDIASGSVHRLPPALRTDLANALQPAFLAASALCIVIFAIVVVWLKQVPLRLEVETPAPEPAAPVISPQRAR